MPAVFSNNDDPFVGARPYSGSEKDQQRFHGRYFETKRIVSYIFSQKATLLYAPSGAGKTSLINAAVIPELERKGCEILPVTRVQISAASNQYLQEVPNKYVFNAILRMSSIEVNPKDVVNETISTFVHNYFKQNTKSDIPVPRLLVFDQFEEIFTVPTVDWLSQRKGLFEQVTDALNKDELLRVMFIIREEFVGQIEKYEDLLPSGFGARFRLGPLTTDNAELAISAPLVNTKRKFDTGVAKKIVSDMAMVKWISQNKEIVEIEGDLIEPVHLQLVGSTLWENLPENITTIKQSDIKQYGDVDKILMDYYENAVGDIIKTNRIKEEKLRKWIDLNLITPAGTRGIVFREKDVTKGLDNKFIDALSNSHIIRGEERSGGFWYELSHDRWIGPIRDANSNWRQLRAKTRQKQNLAGLSLVFSVFMVVGFYKFTKINIDNSIVPPPKGVFDRPVRKLEKPVYGQFNVKRDIRVVDLRSRKKLQFWQTKLGGKYSPVTWLRYTLTKKKIDFIDTQEMVFRFATSGFEVIPRSLTHRYWLETSRTDRSIHPNKNLNMTRHVNVDVSNEKENEFLVTTEATFWNAFQGEEEWVSITPVDKDTEAIGVSILFPKDNLHTEVTLRKHNVKTKEKVNIFKINTEVTPLAIKPETFPTTGRDGEKYELFLDQLNRTVFWLVKNPDVNYRYDVGWTWDQGKTLEDG